jgi:FHA domain
MLCSRAFMKTFTVTPELAPLLEQMSRDMAVPVEGLVNQAIFNWARLHGYAEPSPLVALPAEPETTRVPVVEEPAPRVGDETLPRRAKQKRLVLVLANREVFVEGDRFLIGRDVSCDLTIEAARISRQHAVIRTTVDAWEVEDLGSSNGTWYLGNRITERALEHGDELFFGDVSVRVEFR